jgi:hypothetical protein
VVFVAVEVLSFRDLIEGGIISRLSKFVIVVDVGREGVDSPSYGNVIAVV